MAATAATGMPTGVTGAAAPAGRPLRRLNFCTVAVAVPSGRQICSADITPRHMSCSAHTGVTSRPVRSVSSSSSSSSLRSSSSSSSPPSLLSLPSLPGAPLRSAVGELDGGSSGYGRWQKQRQKLRVGVVVRAAAEARSGEIVQFSADDFSVDRLLGTMGFMNVSSYAPPPFPGSLLSSSSSGSDSDNVAAGYSIGDIARMAGQEVGQGAVKIRLYRGRIVTPGPRMGTQVILKVYPGRGSGGEVDADSLSANELVTHAVLQEAFNEEGEEGSGGGAGGGAPNVADYDSNVCVLLGGFETRTGEKWLVLRDDGFLTAADYVKRAAEATAEGRAVGEGEFWDQFDARRAIRRRETFILEVLRGALRGLDLMHSKGRLHQSLGPASLVLNTVEERDVKFLAPRLRDFAFSVDISSPAALSDDIIRPVGAVQEATANLWRRARSAGATSVLDRRTFGLADDVYAAGLLVALMAFVPLCPPGSIDGPQLQRLLENTFRLDLRAVREYCAADERWANSVAFLDRNGGSGWELLQAMLNADYRQRPSASAALKHPFFAPEGSS